jgi:hypothetical protein
MNQNDDDDSSWGENDAIAQQDEESSFDEQCSEAGRNDLPEPTRCVPEPPQSVLSTTTEEGVRVPSTKSSNRAKKRRPASSNGQRNTRRRENDSVDDGVCVTKSEEKHEIRSILEHLIVQGNYYRHLQWRLQQWKKDQQGVDEMDAPEVEVSTTDETIRKASDSTSEKEEGAKELSARTKQQKLDLNFTLLSAGTGDIHASDARVYHNHGQEPDLWPKLPILVLRETPMADVAWKEEWSDNFINPIAFGQLRLSQQAPLRLLSLSDEAQTALEHAKEDEEDLLYQFYERYAPSHARDHTGFSRQDVIASSPGAVKATAARTMLLHCWERAVHGVSTAWSLNTASPLSAQDDEHPQFEADDNRDNEVPPQSHSTSNHHSVHAVDSQPECNAASVSEWVQQQRESLELIQRILETEVQAQMEQLVEIMLEDAECLLNARKQSSANNQRLGAFDILAMLEQRLNSSRPLGSKEGNKTVDLAGRHQDSHQETLEVRSNEPPMLINWNVLEAARVRIVDRYAKVPR